MAISTLAGSNKWVQLATSSPTSGQTVSFTGLAEYTNYKIVYFDIDLSGSDQLNLRINNDSGSNYAYLRNGDGGDIESLGVATKIKLGTGSTNFSGIITINDANQIVKEINWSHAAAASAQDSLKGNAIWNSQDVINRFDFSIENAQTFSSGTFTVYGRD